MTGNIPFEIALNKDFSFPRVQQFKYMFDYGKNKIEGGHVSYGNYYFENPISL